LLTIIIKVIDHTCIFPVLAVRKIAIPGTRPDDNPREIPGKTKLINPREKRKEKEKKYEPRSNENGTSPKENYIIHWRTKISRTTFGLAGWNSKRHSAKSQNPAVS